MDGHDTMTDLLTAKSDHCCSHGGQTATVVDDAQLVLDPVCGMSVPQDPSANGGPVDYQGIGYYFCSTSCRNRFDADPFYYLSGAHKKAKAQPIEGAKYICPMDPEVSEDGPGPCPICGMALEPGTPSPNADNPELTDFSRRLLVSVLAAVPLLILTMGPMVGLPIREMIGERTAQVLEFLLALPVVLWAARPFFVRGWQSLKSGYTNMWTLIMFGVGAAFCYSVIATFLPGLFPAEMRVAGSVPVYYEAAVVIVALIFVGQVLELKARERTGDAIHALTDLSPETARRLNADGTEYDAPLENILPEDRLRVRPGERIPVDGQIVEGQYLS